MINTYTWAPDTHPNIVINLSSNSETGDITVISVKVGEELVDNPQELYDIILHENVLKNRALDFLVSNLPTEFFKQETDADGDPIWVDSFGVTWLQLGNNFVNEQNVEKSAEEVGVLNPLITIKTKYTPIWYFGDLDRIVSFKVPGISQETKEFLQNIIAAEFGTSVKVE